MHFYFTKKSTRNIWYYIIKEIIDCKVIISNYFFYSKEHFIQLIDNWFNELIYFFFLIKFVVETFRSPCWKLIILSNWEKFQNIWRIKSNHSKDEEADTTEITLKPQVSDESTVLQEEGVPAGIKFVQDIKGMSPETLTVYLEYRELLLEKNNNRAFKWSSFIVNTDMSKNWNRTKMEFQLCLEKLTI